MYCELYTYLSFIQIISMLLAYSSMLNIRVKRNYTYTNKTVIINTINGSVFNSITE